MPQKTNNMNNGNTMPLRFFYKFSGAFLSLLVIVNAIHQILEFNDLGFDYFGKFSLIITITALIIAGIWALIWQRQEASNFQKSNTQKLIVMALIRYFLSFIILTYAASKILGVQFSYGLVTQATPVGQLTNTQLTWYFFGQSYLYSLIISFVQIFACLLLFFRRTALTGAIILLPVIANIMCLNWFYDLWPATKLVSSEYFVMTVFIILSHLKQLKSFLFGSDTSDHTQFSKSKKIALRGCKWIIILLAFLIAFGGMIYYKTITAKQYFNKPVIYGVYSTVKFIRNSENVNILHLENDFWRKIYFDKSYGLITDSKDSTQYILYKTGLKNDSLTITFYSDSPDNFNGQFKKENGFLSLKGIIGGNNVTYVLKQEPFK